MKIIDRLVLTIYTFILSLFSIILILMPFDINFLSIRKLNIYLKVVKNNYFISIIGVALLIVSIRFLISGITTNKRNYIITNTELGELDISIKTIEGLSKKVIEEFKEINETKSSVKIQDKGITLKINGVVDYNIDIPSIGCEIQERIKKHIETYTGINVYEVKVIIDDIKRKTTALK
ncbi:MAG: alkaline shock response membrane anchor protein AmaP [Firmicutes bacterium]|nr:alkaline shock response membrane anchor protein AmaP [Bacillota bacterium]